MGKKELSIIKRIQNIVTTDAETAQQESAAKELERQEKAKEKLKAAFLAIEEFKQELQREGYRVSRIDFKKVLADYEYSILVKKRGMKPLKVSAMCLRYPQEIQLFTTPYLEDVYKYRIPVEEKWVVFHKIGDLTEEKVWLIKQYLYDGFRKWLEFNSSED